MKILFVCTGNINRSAAAEVLGRLLGWDVKSCGLNGREGRLMSPRMRERLGVKEFRSTSISQELVDWADVLVGFQPSHVAALEPYGKPVYLIKIKDPHFDSSGRLHDAALATLREELPRLMEVIK